MGQWMREGALEPGAEFVLFELRLPRVMAAILVGAVLAQSGTAMQGLFRNPLADPALIGISAGAAVGAISSLILIPESFRSASPLGHLQMPLAGLIGGWVTAVAVYKTGNRNGRVSVTAMLLAGIAINAFAGALTGLFIFVADDQQLRSINFWMLGSFGHVSWSNLIWFFPLLLLSIIGLSRYAQALDALLLGESEAYHLGFDVRRLQRSIVFFISAGVGAAVALTGVIGFIGLVVPHLLRLILGPGHRMLLPAAALLGASLLLAADTGARILVAPAELPVGILTALIGTPFFFFLILKSRHLTN
jgi:iron complex transport system permease protein